jgi:hypothetical protein
MYSRKSFIRFYQVPSVLLKVSECASYLQNWNLHVFLQSDLVDPRQIQQVDVALMPVGGENRERDKHEQNITSTKMRNRCPYCFTDTASRQGLHSHMMQKKTCREKMEADAYISESASQTENNNSYSPTQHANEVGPGNLDNDLDNDMAQDFEVPVIHEEHQRSGSPIPGVQVAATVEEEDNEETSRWIEEFPSPAGVPIGEGVSTFEEWRRDQVKNNELPWSPFESQEEWELVQWLITSGISQKKIDAFLNLEMVRFYKLKHHEQVAYY